MQSLFIRFKRLANSRSARLVIGLGIVLVTVAVFVVFFSRHPQYITTLKNVPLSVIAEIIFLNALLTLTLTIIYGLMVELCNGRLGFRENFLLTTYSSIANFFGPLQSGPGVRTAYLKTKHKVRIRDYTLAMVIQYAMFAALSALLMLGGSRPWWALVVVVGIGLVCYVAIQRYKGRPAQQGTITRFQFNKRILGSLLLATTVMVAIVASYYFIELRAVDPQISFHQAVIYTGAANFALFVSLTPDAVGIRESFLVLSQRLHHIPTATILSANLIDRAAYLIYLALLFVFVLAVHARQRLS